MKPQVAEASTLVVDDYEVYARQKAIEYGIDEEDFVRTLDCESRFNPDAVGDKGTSFGIAQIHLPAHPDVSRETALDGLWSIDWAAQQFSEGNARIWTCYRIISQAS